MLLRQTLGSILIGAWMVGAFLLVAAKMHLSWLHVFGIGAAFVGSLAILMTGMTLLEWDSPRDKWLRQCRRQRRIALRKEAPK
jgi:hypothetical protein